MKNLAYLLKPLLRFALMALVLLSLSRVGLVAWQGQRVGDAGWLAETLAIGIRFDLAVTGFFLLWPLLLLPLTATTQRGLALWEAGIRYYGVAALGFITFMEMATPPFIDQYDARPNRIFIEYLVYPKEVFSTLWSAYRLELALAAVAVITVAVMFHRQLRRRRVHSRPIGILTAIFATPCLLMIAGLMVRSTLDHRPLNPSMAALTDDPLVNDLALNSTYSVLYAAYEQRHEPQGGFRYGEMDEQEVFATVRAEAAIAAANQPDPGLPTLHVQAATQLSPGPKNLVILLEESLGAEFVGALGGLPLTANLDALAATGWWFENMYATGTRSVRGIEAVITGFTPTPARSVVKLSGSQRNFFTIAQLLRNEGYDTSFLYGGEAQFDNMRRFLMNNGFAHSLDQDDIPKAEFHGSWGVSDEDLLNFAHEQFSQPHEAPFFSFVFTTTNHSPYDFPDGRIELYDAEKQTVNNAVKFADYAIGEFFRKARVSDYWDDTIFLVVADHNSRVLGAELVPVDHFHIPALILGGGIEPSRYTPVASQIDLPVTLLSLLGISAAHPMIGHDLTRPDFATVPGRAIMQYYDTQAYLLGEDVVVLRKDFEPEFFRYRNNALERTDKADTVLAHTALAHANWASMTYENQLYRLP